MEVLMDYLKKLQIYISRKITKVLITQPFLSYTLNILNGNSSDQSAKVQKQKSTKKNLKKMQKAKTQKMKKYKKKKKTHTKE